jgi:hypothetical protein
MLPAPASVTAAKPLPAQRCGRPSRRHVGSFGGSFSWRGPGSVASTTSTAYVTSFRSPRVLPLRRRHLGRQAACCQQNEKCGGRIDALGIMGGASRVAECMEGGEGGGWGILAYDLK